VQLDTNGGELQYAPNGTAGNVITTSNALTWSSAGVVATPNSNIVVRTNYYPTLTAFMSTAPGTAVANTLAVTSLLTFASSVGSMTVPANTTIAGSGFRLKVSFTAQFNGATDIIFYTLTVNGLTINSMSYSPAAAATFSGKFNVSANIQTGNVIRTFFSEQVGQAGASTPHNFICSNNTAAWDPTIGNVFDIKVQWNNASANNTITALLGRFEYLMYH